MPFINFFFWLFWNGQGGETTKVVDSVLALKSYYDWKVAGGIGTWKYISCAKPPTGKTFFSKNSEPILGSISRLSSISGSSSVSDKSFDAFGSDQYSDVDFGDMVRI